MSHLSVDLLINTQLSDRVIHQDGDTVVDLALACNLVLNGHTLNGVYLNSVDAESADAAYYNAEYPESTLTEKTVTRDLDLSWNLPAAYSTLDLPGYLKTKLTTDVIKYKLSESEILTRFYRVKMELRIWEDRNLTDLIRCIVYILSVFTDNNIIWGTGRGSSCSSYILYLVGLHQVDSVKYELDVGEFLR